MEPVKISLADAAKALECTVDYLLALAEAGHIQIYARVGPHSGEFKNQSGKPPSILDAQHGNLALSGLLTVGEPRYSTLLPQEAALLRSGNPVTVRVLREPGAESGVRFPFSGDEEFCLHLTQPHKVGIDQVCIDEVELGRLTPAAAPLVINVPPIQIELAQQGASVPVDGRFSLREPERADVLSGLIFSVLKAERDAGRPLPSTRALMRMCQDRNRGDITEVSHDEIKFINGDGQVEVANVEAVTKRVKRMTRT
jgi:hypothetical protein